MRRRPGEVRDAVIAYLKQRGADGATMVEIYAAVSEQLGAAPAKSSVRSYLNLNTPDMFERFGRAQYRLRKTARV